MDAPRFAGRGAAVFWRATRRRKQTLSCVLGDDNSPDRFLLKKLPLSGSGLAVKETYF